MCVRGGREGIFTKRNSLRTHIVNFLPRCPLISSVPHYFVFSSLRANTAHFHSLHKLIVHTVVSVSEILLSVVVCLSVCVISRTFMPSSQDSYFQLFFLCYIPSVFCPALNSLLLLINVKKLKSLKQCLTATRPTSHN